MKFFCDSCKTRYSIADERVRGKILKIRCKSCSAVITVREDAEPASSPTGAKSPEPGGAAANVSWYLSRDGEQVGPMKLPAARAWLAKQPPGVDVFCWYDGFGDWKSVVQVSAFKGARAGASAVKPAVPARGPTSLDDRAATEIPSLRPSRPPTATTRTAAAPERSPTGAGRAKPTPGRAAAPGRPNPGGQRTPAPRLTPNPARSQAARPQASRPQASRPQTPRPVAAKRASQTPVPTRRPLKPSVPEAPSPGTSARAQATGRAAPALSAAAAPSLPKPIATPPTLEPSALAPAVKTPAPEPRLETVPSEPPVAAAAESESVDPPKPAGSEPMRIPLKANVRPTNDPFANVPDNDDLDLDIGEPSRVVKLDVLMAGRQMGGAAHMSGPSLPGVKRATMGVPALTDDAPSAGNAAPAFPELAEDIEQEELEPIAMPKRRRSSALVLAVVAILFIGAGTLAFLVLKSDGDSKGDRLAGNGTGEFAELGRQVDKPGRRNGNPGDPDVESGNGTSDNPSKKNRIKRKERKGKNGNGSQSGNGSKNGSGDPENGSGNGSDNGANNGSQEGLQPFSPDDVIRQSNRSQISFKRCFERAKKKDPFLEISSIKIDIKINPAGKVTDIKLSEMSDTYLGNCLKSTVNRWKFRASTEGINTQLAVKFGR